MVSLTELKTLFGIADSDTSEDAWLTEVEKNAVAFIESQTGRYFGPVMPFEEILEGRGRVRLWLTDPPVDEASYGEPSVLVEESAFPGAELVMLEDYQVRIVGQGPGLAGQLIRLNGAVWTNGIEYTAQYLRGYEAGSEPGDIRQLVIDLVSGKRSIRGNEALRSESIGGYSYSRFGDTDIDAVMGGWSTINAWKRLVYA